MQIKKRKNITGAFTLVELLVVISIIAMLLAILMPALGKARRSAQSTVCKTQMKGLGLAMNLYAEANNGNYVTHDDSYAFGYWYARVGPYIGKASGSNLKNTNVFLRCPSGQSIKDYGRDEKNAAWNSLDISLQSYTGKIISVKSPSQFAMFFDFYFGEKSLIGRPGVSGVGNINDVMGATYSTKWYMVVKTLRDSTIYRPKVFRHSNGINVVCADGHVVYAKGPDWWKNMASPSSYGWDKRPQ